MGDLAYTFIAIKYENVFPYIYILGFPCISIEDFLGVST